MIAEKRIRFNILDIIIIVLLIALIAGVLFRNNIEELLNPVKSNEIVYTFGIKQVDSIRLSYLTLDTVISEKDSGASMGRIIKVNSERSKVIEYTIDGKEMLIEKDGLFDVTVKAIAGGFKSDTGVFLNGNILIAPGKTYSIFTSTAVFEITILSVD
ncbi:MAG: hypothetical protein A2Y15_07915 [Clostridiales bacterium GWF2_36_10]|nr:MAG: hypothetical protein A2Y15_07915 [Clostridiales bacterium GWF2_36_10]HAN20271.1 hypothetical protein [Clostridiales bacterium]